MSTSKLASHDTIAYCEHLDGGLLASSKCLLGRDELVHTIDHGLNKAHFGLTKTLLVGNVVHSTISLRVFTVNTAWLRQLE